MIQILNTLTCVRQKINKMEFEQLVSKESIQTNTQLNGYNWKIP